MNARSQFARGDPAVKRIQEAYESLRKQIVEPSSYTQWELGFAILRCRGLVAWIDACWSHASPIVSVSAANHDAADSVVPAGVEGEIVMVLAGMALHTASAEVTYGD
jgi:hypothetical protein